jgi:hypothetical protein
MLVGILFCFVDLCVWIFFVHGYTRRFVERGLEKRGITFYQMQQNVKNKKEEEEEHPIFLLTIILKKNDNESKLMTYLDPLHQIRHMLIIPPSSQNTNT